MLLKIWSICPAEASEEIWIWTLMLSSGSGRRFFTASPPSSTKPGLTLGVFAVAFVAAVLFCVGAAFVTAASVGRLQAALAREGRPPTLAKAPCSRLGSCLMRRVRSTSPPEACGLEPNANQQVRAYVQERLGGSPTIIPTRCTGGLYGRAVREGLPSPSWSGCRCTELRGMGPFDSAPDRINPCRRLRSNGGLTILSGRSGPVRDTASRRVHWTTHSTSSRDVLGEAQ